MDITNRIIGTWRLVHAISIDSEGRKEYPFGEDAIGYIHYGDTGVMAVQISRRSRKGAGSISDLKHDYLAYFGRYEVDPERHVVRHLVEGELFPGGHPKILEREYRFEGDFMILKPLDGTNREIVWQRVHEASAQKAAYYSYVAVRHSRDMEAASLKSWTPT